MFDVKTHFRPEFLNRLDDIIIFTPLSVQGKYSLFTVSFFLQGTMIQQFFDIYQFRYS